MPRKAAPLAPPVPKTPPSPAPAPQRPKPKSLTIWLPKDDNTTLPNLKLLVDLWYAQGLIPEPSQGQAVRFMVKNFGQLSRALEANVQNGSLPLDAARRRELNNLRQILQVGGDIPKESHDDLPVVNIALDVLFIAFTNKQNGAAYLDEYLRARGKL